MKIISLLLLICCLKNFSKLLKGRLHWYHNYCSVMQRFFKVTLTYQPVNYLKFKNTRSKTTAALYQNQLSDCIINHNLAITKID